MHVVASEIDLRIPDAQSLKDRRQVVTSLVESARRRFGVSIAEVGGQDTWQRAVIGVAVVSGTARQAEQVLDTVEDHIWALPMVEVLSAERTWMEM